MKTVYLLCLVVACTAVTDPWVPFLRQRLDGLLKEASGNWSEEVSATDVTADIVQRSEGWLSLRDGVLHNLSSWTVQEDVSLNCTLETGLVTANVSFQALPFFFSYLYDNGTSLGASGNVSGTLQGLTARLGFMVIVHMHLGSIYVYTTFNFQTENTSVEVASLQNVPVKKEEIASAIGRALNEKILTDVQQRIERNLNCTELKVHFMSVPNACTIATTSASTIPTTPPTTKTTETTNTTVATNTNTRVAAKKTTAGAAKHISITTMATKKRIYKPWVEESDYGNEEHNNFESRAVTPTYQSQLNDLINAVLNEAVKSFPSHGLEPYKMPDIEDEIYQKAEGAVEMNVTLKRLRNATVAGDPRVQRTDETARVTADVQFRGVTYSAHLWNASGDSAWTVGGDVGHLEGQLFVSVRYNNSSAATVTLEGFQLTPFVLLTSSSTASTKGTEVDAEEIEDAVRGVLKAEMIPMLCADASDSLETTSREQVWDVSSLMPTTTTSVTSTTTPPVPSTTSPVTSTASPVTSTTSPVTSTTTSSETSTKPNSAPPPCSIRSWTTVAATVFSVLLATKIYL